jgi:DNA-binding transcriptional LysR family regulator
LLTTDRDDDLLERSAIRGIEGGGNAATNRLRVSRPLLFGRLRIAPILTRLADAHPKQGRDLNFSARLVDVVQADFDLAVGNGPACRIGPA